MHRKIYTKQESLTGVPFQTAFLILWYSVLFRTLFRNPELFWNNLIFLLFGLIPLIALIQQIRRAWYFRRLHRQCMESAPRSGQIIDCQRQYYQQRTSRGHYRTAADYRLTVEVYDPATGLPVRIQSEAYAWPVYRVLASPDVDVYTDETGWHYVIDGFRYKTSRHEPDIFTESAFDRAPGEGSGRLIQAIVVIVILMMIARVVLRSLFF